MSEPDFNPSLDDEKTFYGENRPEVNKRKKRPLTSTFDNQDRKRAKLEPNSDGDDDEVTVEVKRPAFVQGGDQPSSAAGRSPDSTQRPGLRSPHSGLGTISPGEFSDLSGLSGHSTLPRQEPESEVIYYLDSSELTSSRSRSVSPALSGIQELDEVTPVKVKSWAVAVGSRTGARRQLNFKPNTGSALVQHHQTEEDDEE